ncbi:hypothetical protein [Methanorbis furvi]|uniref:Uncharacterized protein n=1 Tax=Methanorbis furvi TaxID=3028299 RepID=A0AAE4MC99_9EURY|nr:hypothetical protein [Methanocorpusculaceae archaeon Ag1]
MIEDFNNLYELIMAVVAAVAALIAWIKDKQAKNEAAYADEVQKYFDPADNTVQAPPEGTPKRSYTMSDEVKNFLIFGESEEDQRKMLEQVREAEAKDLCEYRVSYSRGYYNISYGQIAGGAKYA